MKDAAHKEAAEMFKTLQWTVGMIMQSGPDERQHIANAYHEAQDLMASPLLEGSDARQRIVACFERSDVYRAANDSAGVGWVLSAIQERVNEKDLPDWRKFRKVVRQAVEMLSISKPTIH